MGSGRDQTSLQSRMLRSIKTKSDLLLLRNFLPAWQEQKKPDSSTSFNDVSFKALSKLHLRMFH
jgi:hypothetical protein